MAEGREDVCDRGVPAPGRQDLSWCVEATQGALGLRVGALGRAKRRFRGCDRNSNLSDDDTDDDDVEAASCDIGRGDIALSRVWREREMIHGQGWVFSTPARDH